ncbi:hypothetical protein [Streptomyces sp. H27-D2]|uniref:hypothetical protein n=1 Tax=Streptomyces sp. H27-D2 TaxID=3046304 RepID=UPI002DBDE02F|nr:hypothetical protein [Streptomyces sp. H27-D2]MEC4018242.1 hypothetical protein [Streptomyces sp. H27-D2]
MSQPPKARAGSSRLRDTKTKDKPVKQAEQEKQQPTPAPERQGPERQGQGQQQRKRLQSVKGKVQAASSLSALPSLLRRLVRQDSSDQLAVKLLPRIVFGLAAAYTLFHVASSSGSAFVGLCLVFGLALLGWLLRKRGQLLIALVSTLVTAAVTGNMAAVADTARGVSGSAVSGQAVFGYWALAGMALLGAWMVKDHPGRRGVTVVIAGVVLVIASFVGALVPAAAVPIGFLGIVAVLMIRGRGFAAVRRRMEATRALLGRGTARMGKGS